MKFVTLEQAQQYIKTDGDDDDTLTLCVDAAEAACVTYCNRSIFADEAERDAALAATPADAQAARTQYDAALAAAEEMEPGIERDESILLANTIYDSQRAEISSVRRGKIAQDDFKAAVLRTAGSFYANREDVVAGQGATAAELPMNSKFYLAPYFYAGA